MPESTCLHIQDHESGPIRVVDIPWISVRIGRAAFCEVRLTSDDLADEACRLYRRGRSWHLVPVGGKSKILVDGRSVDASCPLPFDVPFRVGRHCLTLRQDRTADPDWEMYPGSVPAQLRLVRARVERRSRRPRIMPDQRRPDHRFAAGGRGSLKPEWRPHATTKGAIRAVSTPPRPA